MASKQKLVEGDHVYVKGRVGTGVWEVYAVRKSGRTIRYSIKLLDTPAITLFCNVEGKKLRKVEEK